MRIERSRFSRGMLGALALAVYVLPALARGQAPGSAPAEPSGVQAPSSPTEVETPARPTPLDVRVVAVTVAPAHHIVVTGRPDQIVLDGKLCALSGAAWAGLGPTPEVVAIAADRFESGWIDIEVASAGAACEAAVAARIFVTGEAPFPGPVRGSRATIRAESRVAEVRGADLGAYQLVTVEDGQVTGAESCRGQRTCALPLQRDFVRAWLRRERVALALWPAALPLAAGDPFPALIGPDGAWTTWRDFAVPSVEVAFHHPLLAVEEINIAAERATLPLLVPEAVKDVRCQRARCTLSTQGVEVFGVDPAVLSVVVQLELAPGVVRRVDGRSVERESLEVPIVRCAMQAAAPVPLLAGAANHRYVLAIGRECLDGRPRELLVETRPPTYAWIKAEMPSVDPAWRYFEVVFEKVPEGIRSLELTVARRELQRTNLGVVPIPVEGGYRPLGVRFTVEDLGVIDFVPSNREAGLHLAFEDERWSRDVQVEDRPGYYHVRRVDEATATIRAVPGAPGSVALRLAYAPEALARVLGRREALVTFDTEARYPLRQLNVPLAITPRDGAGPRFVRVVCAVDGEDLVVEPGRAFSIPYSQRDGCRVVIDRHAIPESAGEQRLRITGGGDEQILTVSHRAGAVTIALAAEDKEEFDRLVVTVGHEYGGGHYDLGPRHNIGAEARWRIVLGDRSFRVSAGTAVPTGLFRFGAGGDRRSVPLSAGVTARFAYLYKEGTEFPIGLELGVLGTGLSETPHLSIVAGIGFSIPVLNKDTVLQTSFNIHAWAEYSPTRASDGESAWAFLFGPSFSVGKFSTTL